MRDCKSLLGGFKSYTGAPTKMRRPASKQRKAAWLITGNIQDRYLSGPPEIMEDSHNNSLRRLASHRRPERVVSVRPTHLPPNNKSMWLTPLHKEPPLLVPISVWAKRLVVCFRSRVCNFRVLPLRPFRPVIVMALRLRLRYPLV